MFVMMLISLYSSRIILQALGKSDYGLYSVVGGFIALFFFISNSLSVATERFMAYAIGKKDDVLRKKIFSLFLVLYAVLAVIILLVGLIIGIPFVKYQLNIPEGRELAAQFVFVFSLFTAIVSFMRIPYNAAIIANEKMGFYSWISIAEAILKLLIIYLLLVVDYDKLETYAAFQLLATLIVTLVYVIYCSINFNDYITKGVFDKTLIVKLGNFAGWNFYGGLADMSILQGLSILLNLFFGTIINAAQAIANAIKSQIAASINNINIASGPAFTKYYAEGDLISVRNLLFTISKINYFLLLLICLPIIIVLPSILNVWLGVGAYPQETVIFTRLLLINTLIDTVPGAAQSVVFASGKIGKYQFIISSLKYISILFVFFIFKLYDKPETAYYVLIVFALPRIIYQIYYCCYLLKITMTDFIKNILIKDVQVTILSVIVAYSIVRTVHFLLEIPSLINLIEGVSILIMTALIVFVVGLNSLERGRILNIIKKRLKKD